MTTVLVTGVGAIIGYGILRSLRQASRPLRLIGADIYADAVGQAWVDDFVQAPLTADTDYLAWLEKTIIDKRVDMVMPGIEQDLYCFAANRSFFRRLGVAVVLNSDLLMTLTADKWLMHEELKRIGSAARIPSSLSGDFASLARDLGTPFLLKPRKSYASKGLVKVSTPAEFAGHSANLGTHLMAQPVIGSDDEEYTIAVFGDGSGQAKASIALRRRLAPDGSTAKAWVASPPGLEGAVASLCAHFKPVGPTNLQFRKDGADWKLLEINPRISSTTSIRTAFGYNEPEMCVDYFVGGKTITQPVLRQGFAARYIEDRIVYDRDNF
jgi:carbamoyl-phosphate synthase large subunit